MLTNDPTTYPLGPPPMCEKKVFKWKPQYTGYPAPMRQCCNMATYRVEGQNLCTRHTPKELRMKENKI
jgi:hypothetical protein